MSTSVNQLGSMPFSIQRTLGIPDEGPKALPLTLDFTAANEYTLDYSSMQQRGFLSLIQTLYVDTQNSDVALTVTIAGGGQVVIAKGRTQGYYPVLVPNPPRFTFSAENAGCLVQVYLINVPIQPGQWSTI
jgi:hypothetical protein